MSYQRKEIIGEATLYLGDCMDIMPTLGKVDAVVTDPPFNVGKNYGENVDDAKDNYYEWFDDVLSKIRELTDGRFVVFGMSTHWRYFAKHDDVMPVTYVLCGSGASMGKFNRRHSFVWCGKPICRVDTVWQDGRAISNEKGNMFRKLEHPGMTSVDATKRMLHGFSQEGETILDPFCGTGTTGQVATSNGRKFIGIEIEEKYFDIACRRIEEAQKQLRLFA